MRRIVYNSIDFLELQKEIYTLLNSNKNESFEKRVSTALDLYISKILHTEKVTYYGTSILIGGDNQHLIVRSKDISSAIKRIVKNYLNGHLQTCYRRISTQMQNLACKYEMVPGQTFFRMRVNGSAQSFNYKDMFHVPFDKIQFLGNYRYSIAGFPCLYISPKAETCWHELRNPNINSCNVSAIRNSGEKLKLIDLRWNKPLKTNDYGKTIEGDLLQYLIIFPFVIACSIPTASDEDKFHIEYIIPQIFLHNLLINSHCGDGVIYTSSRIPCSFTNEEEYRYDCVVLPARRGLKEENISKYLSDRFEITDAISPHDILVKYLDVATRIQIGDSPSKSIFTLMENVLKEKEHYKINE